MTIMNFGANGFQWIQQQFLYIYLAAVVIGVTVLAFKRSLNGLIAFIIVMSIIGVVVSTPRNLLALGQKLWSTIMG